LCKPGSFPGGLDLTGWTRLLVADDVREKVSEVTGPHPRRLWFGDGLDWAAARPRRPRRVK